MMNIHGTQRSLLADMPRLTLLGLAAFVVLAPYVWMIAVSVKPQDEVFKASLSLIPHRFALVENFGKACQSKRQRLYSRF